MTPLDVICGPSVYVAVYSGAVVMYLIKVSLQRLSGSGHSQCWCVRKQRPYHVQCYFLLPAMPSPSAMVTVHNPSLLIGLWRSVGFGVACRVNRGWG